MFRCNVVPTTWNACDPQHSRVVDQQPSRGFVFLSEESDSLSANICSGPEIIIEQPASLVLRGGFYVSAN